MSVSEGSQGLTGPVQDFRQWRSERLAEIEQEKTRFTEDLKSKVPVALATWVANTESIDALIERGFFYCKYWEEYLPEWGFASLEDGLEQLRKLEHAWEGVAHVHVGIGGKHEYVELTLQAI